MFCHHGAANWLQRTCMPSDQIFDLQHALQTLSDPEGRTFSSRPTSLRLCVLLGCFWPTKWRLLRLS